MKEEALMAAYESAKDRMDLESDEFIDLFKDWDVHPVVVRNEVMGAVLIKGNQLHACIKPQGFKRWLTRSVLENTLYKVIKKHGKAITSVKTGNQEGDRFVRGLGFMPFSEDCGVTWYEVPHGH